MPGHKLAKANKCLILDGKFKNLKHPIKFPIYHFEP